MYESVTFRSGHPVLTLISKLHKDSSIHIYKRMFSFIWNLLDVVLMFISKCNTKTSI